jgi:eukaryotic-like serine/threonine-protein kinase
MEDRAMNAEKPNVKAIFDEAVEIEDSGARRSYLDRACTSDVELRRKLDALLQAYGDAGSFLQKPAIDADLTDPFTPSARLPVPQEPRPITEGPGTCIGPYKLLQPIGEGGMGIVYMAEQEKPVRRRVALKIIKPGMDSQQVIARFEAERQALALMDHQNIARVLDAGTTETGRPYFVMELVHGVPITKYCDDTQLNPRERLALFIPVCQALQHAHQKGIIHRDIKPSNVLVTLYDGKPVAKVIDFGVAKATDQRLTERTMFTQYGSIVGTLEYMSPEQAEMSALGVDTRSDVYALGVLLYELLTGTTPLERTSLREAGYAEILRRIKEEEPPRPSTRLSASGDALPSISAQRKTESAKLAKLMRGEVDWIVMKCLEKDRTRRYESANGLARDVERYLADEAVEACPPSASYRLRKFARKHRVALATGSAFATLLILATLLSAWQAIRARDERDRAVVAERVAKVSRREAEAKRREAELARQSLRRSLYVSDIQRVQAAWGSDDLDGMRDLLNQQRPRSGDDDLRGFEWRYLRRLGSSIRVVELSNNLGFGTMSRDGTRYVATVYSRSKNGPPNASELELRLVDGLSGRDVRTIDPYPGEIQSFGLNSIQFSPNGQRFVHHSRTPDASGRTVKWGFKVWDWLTGRTVFARSDLTTMVSALALDPSATRLATGIARPGDQGGDDLIIWDIDGGKQLLAIPLPDGHFRGPSAITFSPDGTHIAALLWPARPYTANAPLELRAWDATTGKELFRHGAGPRATGLAYSPDGRTLAVSCDGGPMHRIRDAGSGKEILKLTMREEGQIKLLTGSDSIAFSPDGTRLAYVPEGGKVQIWDVTPDETRASRSPDLILKGNWAIISQLAWSADGRFVSASGQGRKIVTWQIQAQDEHLALKGTDEATWVGPTAAASANRFAAALETQQGLGKTEIKVWDQAGQVLFQTTEPAVDGPRNSFSGRAVELSRDGTRLAYRATHRSRTDGPEKLVVQFRAWDIATGRSVFHREREETIALDAGLYFDDVALSSDGRLLATVAARGSSSARKSLLSVWELDSGLERLHRDLDGDLLHRVVFSPDSRRVAGTFWSRHMASQASGLLRVWEVATGQVVLSREWDEHSAGEPSYSGDGRWLALPLTKTGGGGVIKVLEAASGEERQSLAGHGYGFGRVTFSPDSRRLASFSFSRTDGSDVKLWDLAAGKDLLTFSTKALEQPALRKAMYSPTRSLSFSPDGNRLFFVVGSYGREATVQVWDATPLPDEQAEASRRRP